ncbi:MAG: helix-turn-helix transcriptional regulator [Deltaproteobacteria bacterium]|nr:helix-turn-helix transcriptional regulator [Deltaproteobacteria bacterium]
MADAGALQTDRLTDRETEVLRLVAQGKTSKEIATILSISPKTVENHRHNIMEKLGVHDVASLTRLALASGIVAPE